MVFDFPHYFGCKMVVALNRVKPPSKTVLLVYYLYVLYHIILLYSRFENTENS